MMRRDPVASVVSERIPVSSPRANGQITVTLAASVLASSNSLALALPIQQSSKGNSGGRDGGGREDCWNEGTTAVVIHLWDLDELRFQKNLNLRKYSYFFNP
ncbi:hypothetical protein VIGAN_02109000 [Vigna angularis var. angularis]|uniref:Uncharacterized protein n=1 Tax=Vigna angularis var. angularis TaxID=157739 RepID=A0A0S3RD08_PHAAN|nr:hypothetical protein VIGAN_02109000 [Vigna angularis var. angularis]